MDEFEIHRVGRGEANRTSQLAFPSWRPTIVMALMLA
jgi:hypothetical protein